MWEFLHLDKAEPWSACSPSARTYFSLDESFKKAQRVKAGERPNIDPTASDASPAGFVALLKECWAQDPGRRPTAEQVASRLAIMLTSLA